MKKLRVFVLSAAVACALSVPALGGIASANQNNNNNNNGGYCQNGVIVNGHCVNN
jgi:hypothetical protein